MTPPLTSHDLTSCVVEITEALMDAWPDTAFTVAASRQLLSVTWTDGPGRRAVINTVRLNGWGTAPLRANRTLSPGALVNLLRAGVSPRDALNAPACGVDPQASAAAARLSERSVDVNRAMLAFARLSSTELDIAAVLAHDDPALPFDEVVHAARALARDEP